MQSVCLSIKTACDLSQGDMSVIFLVNLIVFSQSGIITVVINVKTIVTGMHLPQSWENNLAAKWLRWGDAN